MNLDPLSFTLFQINRLVAGLNKDNYQQTVQELLQLVSAHGPRAEEQLLRRARGGRSASALLARRLTALLAHPARATPLCLLAELPPLDQAPTSANSLERLSRSLQLSIAEDVAFALVLRCCSSQRDVLAAAEKLLEDKYPDLVQSYLDLEGGHQVDRAGLQECSPEVLQTLLIGLIVDNNQIPTATKDSFLDRLRADFPRAVVPIVLAPLLYPDDTKTPLEEVTTSADLSIAMMENSLAEVIKDIGFTFTSSVEDCKNYMANFEMTDPSPMDIAKMLSVMMRCNSTDGSKLQTPGSFWLNESARIDLHGETWNAEVFVQALKDMTTSFNWKEVIIQLDHPGFLVPDRQGLVLLFQVLRMGFQSEGYPMNTFPVEYLCRRWQNSDGQLSLISNILKNPDIFSFADYPLHPVSVDILKSVPESDNKEILTWRGLSLIELLLYLSERGYYVQVYELFKFPLQHCPDILLLALLKISAATVLRQELLTALVPIFLGNHPNSGILLQHAWHAQNPNLKPVIMHAMADWYIRGDCDQMKLSRILDIAQDLKALSLLLNVQSFPFIIDLACLASRRDYLKLDKWLTDKIRDHGEAFVAAMVKFVQKRCVMGPEELPKAAQLPPETIGTLLACLQLCISNVQQDLQEAIYNVIANQTIYLNKLRQMIPNITRPRDTFNLPTSMNLFSGQFDPTLNLTPAINNMTLGGSAFLNGSPPRLMGAGANSPFGMMPMQHVSSLGFERIAPMPMEPPRLPDPIPLPDVSHNIPKDIEEEANSYFQKIYNHPPYPSLSIEEVLEMLKKFQESTNKREHDVFSCMLRNLFEEYKFFPQYPEKELHITAQLFGGIIERGLVPSYVSLGLALRFVLDALRKPDNTKMYFFGIVALDRFKSRLKDYHMYCEHVRALPHFKQFPPHLIEYVEYGLKSKEPPSKPQGSVLPTSLASVLTPNIATTASTPYRAPNVATAMSKISAAPPGGRPSIANATNIDTLLTATDVQEKVIPPPESIQDKTFFIFNNLSQLNLQTKCEELRELLTEEYYPWLSQYLVMKRASIEFNFHTLYSNFLDVFKVRAVNNMVTAETYRNIKVLLRTEKGIENFSDRSLLKNLGHWLGVITLGRNQPILHVDLNLKALILEAYHKGQQELLYVVPFVAKVLESCAKGCFKPPNPWTMSLINVLAELHQEPELKLNLKFEVEVLCKNLSVDITELKPNVYLKNPENLKLIEFQLAVDQPSKPTAQSSEAPQQATVPPPTVPTDSGISIPIPASLIPTENLTDILGVPQPKFSYHEINFTASTFEQIISYNRHIALFQSYPQLKQLVKPSIERSIQEWIHPVVDRSIKQALTTCEQIVRKDFACEPSELRMRVAAHHMMRNLTAAMALITCRGQIVSTISTNLKAAFVTALLPTTQHQKEMVESAAALLAADNMELACALIQRSAVEQALPEIDRRLAGEYAARCQARAAGESFAGQAAAPTDEQLLVYEQFARCIPGFLPSGAAPPPDAATAQMFADELSALATAVQTFAARARSPALASNARALLESVSRARHALDASSARALLLQAVEGLLDSQPPPGGCTRELARYRSLHARALRPLAGARGADWAARHVTRAVLAARDALRHNVDALDLLLERRLLHADQYDAALAAQVEEGRDSAALTCATGLLQRAPARLPRTADTLLRVMSTRPAPEGLPALLEALRGAREPPPDPADEIHEEVAVALSGAYEPEPPCAAAAERLLREWRALLAAPLAAPQLAHRLPLFARRAAALPPRALLQHAVDAAVEHVYELMEGDNGTPAAAVRRSRYYSLCDAVARLAALLVTTAEGARAQLSLLNQTLGVMVGVLLRDHGRRGAGFRQLPYQRLLLMLLLDLEELEPALDSTNYEVVRSFCAALRTVRPAAAPGFCYAWLDLVAHRGFVQRALADLPHGKEPRARTALLASAVRARAVSTPNRGWDLYSVLLLELFKFLDPMLRVASPPPPVLALYRGTVKVLLVLLHDFPDYLCQFCEQLTGGTDLRSLLQGAGPLAGPFAGIFAGVSAGVSAGASAAAAE